MKIARRNIMQRKATKNTRARNKRENDFHDWIKQRPCCVTGQVGVQLHHCKGETFKHNKTLIGHLFCIPLSVEAHAEYHAGTKAFRQKYCAQSLLWHGEYTEYLLQLGYPWANLSEAERLYMTELWPPADSAVLAIMDYGQ